MHMQPRRLSTRITPSSCLRLLAAAAAAGVLGTAAACSDDANPAAPSALSSPAAPSSGGSPAAGRAALQPVRAGDVDTVAPGDARYGPNAYDFFATWDGSALNVALVEDAMAGMRRASQPHRMRAIEVFHCNSEPRHVLQTCGAPLYSGALQLAGRLELPPIELAACTSREWLVVTAAELSDDRYDGWRNAPCPRPNGVAVGSDGTGPGWDRGEHGPPERNFPEPEPEPEAEPAPTPDPPSGPAPTPPSGPAPTPDPPSGPAPTPDPPSGPAPTPPSGPAPTPPSGPAPTPPSGPAPEPDSPSTPVPTPPPAPADPAAPSWFSPSLYDLLVYRAYGGFVETHAYVLGNAATLNVLFYHAGRLDTSQTCAANAIPAAVVNPLAQVTRGAIRAATGRDWSGRTELTTSASRADTVRRTPGWVVVDFDHPRIYPLLPPDAAAAAVVGDPSGGIQIFIDDDCSLPSAPELLSVYVHELGHVLGFFHVSEPSWLMFPISLSRTMPGSYDQDERRHMQRAYQLGPRYPRSSSVWSLLPPDSFPGLRPPRKRIVAVD